MTKKARINQQMGQNNQKDQKGPKMTAAVMLVQNNQNNQKIWSLHISHTILKVRFFWDTLYMLGIIFVLWTLQAWLGKPPQKIGIPHICHFFYTGRIFENQILHPKKRLKAPKTLKMSLKKSNICIFFYSI